MKNIHDIKNVTNNEKGLPYVINTVMILISFSYYIVLCYM